MKTLQKKWSTGTIIDEKKLPREVMSFFKIVVAGIRGEYEKGWSPRDDKRDIKTLKSILNQ